jgi:hypothetical protein
MFSILIVNVILLLRTWAIWGKSRVVLGCLAVLLTVSTFVYHVIHSKETDHHTSSVRSPKGVLPFTLMSVRIPISSYPHTGPHLHLPVVL